jgi:hypothetical protein
LSLNWLPPVAENGGERRWNQSWVLCPVDSDLLKIISEV